MDNCVLPTSNNSYNCCAAMPPSNMVAALASWLCSDESTDGRALRCDALRDKNVTILYQNYIMLSFWHTNDAIIMACVRWVYYFQSRCIW